MTTGTFETELERCTCCLLPPHCRCEEVVRVVGEFSVTWGHPGVFDGPADNWREPEGNELDLLSYSAVDDDGKEFETDFSEAEMVSILSAAESAMESLT